ncbi:hypothetical protein [Archaeoglobus sp.]
MFKKFLIFSLLLASTLAFSYAQFNEDLYIGDPAHANTVTTGELDAGIWAWMGVSLYPYMTVEPIAKIWGYDNAVKTVEFEVNNAYPGAKTFNLVWVRNTGTIAAKVESIKWDVNGEPCDCEPIWGGFGEVCDCDYMSIKYFGGEIPDWLAENVTEFVNELHENGTIDDATYNEMTETIEMRKSTTGALHEGLVLDVGENDIMIFFWTFKDDTPENASFKGNCTIVFTQFNQ